MPKPWRIAATYSAMRSPACSPAMVAPRILSLPGCVSTFTRPSRLAVGDRAVEIVDAVGRDLVGDALLLRLGLVQAHARDFRVGERRPRNHRVVDAEFPEAAEERVHGAVPRHVRRGVRELVRARDVAARVDVGIGRLQEFVDVDGALLRRADAQLLEAVALDVRDAPDGAEDLVAGDAPVASFMLDDERSSRRLRRALPSPCGPTRTSMPSARKRFVTSSENSGSSRESRRGSISTCVTFAPKRANACASSQPIGPPPSTTRRAGSLRRSQTVSEVSGFDFARAPGSAGTNGRAARRDHDALRRERALVAVAERHLHRPGRRDLRAALQAVDAELRVALDRVVRLDLRDDLLHALHHLGEVEVRRGAADAVVLRAPDLRERAWRS